MKKNILLLFVFIYCTQVFAQQEGVIYNFSFVIDRALTESFSAENKSKKILSGVGVSDEMPGELIDSICKKTEAAFSENLKMPVRICYRKNKKGEELKNDWNGVNAFEGLPSHTFKGGKETCPVENFISIDCRITSGEFSIDLGDGKKSKLKPGIHLAAKIVDADKNELFSKNIKIKNLAKLRSLTEYYGKWEVRNSETLTPYDIYAIYLMALDELMKQ